jgi:hypothetical protein
MLGEAWLSGYAAGCKQRSPAARQATRNAAVALGRLGGQAKVPKGFATMDPARRAEIARLAARKRWGAKKKAR